MFQKQSMANQEPIIIRLLHRMSPEEKRILKKTVISNRKKHHQKLLSYLFKATQTNKTSYNKGLAMRTTFGKDINPEEYEIKFRKTNSDLIKEVENLFLNEIINKNEGLKYYLILVEINKRKANSLFKRYQKLSNKGLLDSDQYLPFNVPTIKSQLSLIDYFDYETFYVPKYSSEKLVDLISTDEKKFLLKKFCLQVEIEVYRGAFKETSIFKKVEEDWRFWLPIFTHKAKQWPLLNWLLGLLKQLKEKKSSFKWAILLSQLENYSSELDQWHKLMIIKLIINIGSNLLKENSLEVAAQLHEAHKYCFDQGYMPFEGSIDTGHFINIAIVGAFVGEYLWVKKYIDENIDFLGDKKNRSIVKIISNGYCDYYKGINQMDFKLLEKNYKRLNFSPSLDPRLMIRAKSLKLRIAYELRHKQIAENIDFVDNVHNMLRYIREKPELSVSLQKSYQKFGRFALQLFEIQYLSEEKRLRRQKALQDEIEKASNLILRQWLLDKLDT